MGRFHAIFGCSCCLLSLWLVWWLLRLAQLAQDLWLVSTKSLPFRTRTLRTRSTRAEPCLGPSATDSPTSLSLRSRARRERLRTLPLTSTTSRRAPTSSRPRPTRRAVLPPPRVLHRAGLAAEEEVLPRRRRASPSAPSSSSAPFASPSPTAQQAWPSTY